MAVSADICNTVSILMAEDIHWVSQTLSESGYLVQHKERFCGGLGLLSSEVEDINAKISWGRSGGSYEFFVYALEQFMSKYGSECTFDKLIGVLREGQFNAVADAIQRLQCQARGTLKSRSRKPPKLEMSSSRSTFFGVPDKISLFTGRADELEDLHKAILKQNSDSEKEITVITALTAMGGMGKTTLSIHYAWIFFEDRKFYKNVAWINSESEVTITGSIAKLAEKLKVSILGPNGKRLLLVEILEQVYEKFSESESETLVIFDNVEEYKTIQDYLPVRKPFTKKPFVLATSRYKVWNLKTDVIELNVFREKDSIQLITDYLRLGDSNELRNYAKEISIALQNLPLAIRQAAAYISMQINDQPEGVSRTNKLIELMRSYIEQLNICAKSLLTCEYWTETLDKYEKTTYMTWNVTLQTIKLKNPLARQIMELSSYFNPDDIPVELFQYLEDSPGILNRVSQILKRNRIRTTRTRPRAHVLNAIKILSDYSMVTSKHDWPEMLFNVHRVVQKVVRLQVEEKESYSKLLQAVRLIKFPLGVNRFGNFERLCLLHAHSIWECSLAAGLNKINVELLQLINLKLNNSIDHYLTDLKTLFEGNLISDAVEKENQFRLEIKKSTIKSVVQNYLCKVSHLLCESIKTLAKRTDDFENVLILMTRLHLILIDLISRKKLDLDSTKLTLVFAQVYNMCSHETKDNNSGRPERIVLINQIFAQELSITNLLYDHVYQPNPHKVSRFGFFLGLSLRTSLQIQCAARVPNFSLGISRSLMDFCEICNTTNTYSEMEKLEKETFEVYFLLYKFYNLQNNHKLIFLTGKVVLGLLVYLGRPAELVLVGTEISKALDSFCENRTESQKKLSKLTPIPYFFLLHAEDERFTAAVQNEMVEIALHGYRTLNRIAKIGQKWLSFLNIIHCLVKLHRLDEVLSTTSKYADYLTQLCGDDFSQYADYTDIYLVTTGLFKHLNDSTCAPIKETLTRQIVHILQTFYDFFSTRYYSTAAEGKTIAVSFGWLHANPNKSFRSCILSQITIDLAKLLTRSGQIQETLELMTIFKSIAAIRIENNVDNKFSLTLLDVAEVLWTIGLRLGNIDMTEEYAENLYDIFKLVFDQRADLLIPDITRCTLGLINCLDTMQRRSEIHALVTEVIEFLAASPDFTVDNKREFYRVIDDSITYDLGLEGDKEMCKILRDLIS